MPTRSRSVLASGHSAHSSESIQVAVRCRPFNNREIQLGADCVVSMLSGQTQITDPNAKPAATSAFTFDHSFWSHEPDAPGHVTNAEVYEQLGADVVAAAFSGLNNCIFAYVGDILSNAIILLETNLVIIIQLTQSVWATNPGTARRAPAKLTA